jgi:hypothetical protein
MMVSTGAGLVTVTVPLQVLEAPWLSVTVSVTLVAPSAYGPGGDCASVIVSPASGSEEPLSMDAAAVQPAPDEHHAWRHATGGLLAAEDQAEDGATPHAAAIGCAVAAVRPSASTPKGEPPSTP